jgi:hypothetical protein
MSKGENDILALVINSLEVDWQPKHITFTFFRQQILVDKPWPKF